ncbi:MAG: DUF7507 domain-containing protein [Ilumatobacteraceae bacterium]
MTDNKINGGQPFNCGPATKVISVNLDQMCTAYYTITAADVAAGSVTNVAFASGGTVDSNTATATAREFPLLRSICEPRDRRRGTDVHDRRRKASLWHPIANPGSEFVLRRRLGSDGRSR